MPEDLALFVRFAPYRAKSWHFWSRSCSWTLGAERVFSCKVSFSRGSTLGTRVLIHSHTNIYLVNQDCVDALQRISRWPAWQLPCQIASYIEPVHGAYKPTHGGHPPGTKRPRRNGYLPTFGGVP